jgi:hypothetical protein
MIKRARSGKELQKRFRSLREWTETKALQMNKDKLRSWSSEKGETATNPMPNLCKKSTFANFLKCPEIAL